MRRDRDRGKREDAAAGRRGRRRRDSGEARLLLETDAARQRDMKGQCRHYNPKPVGEMTPEEARQFAIRLAVEASESIRMTQDEQLLYASEVFQSIMRMNRADERWRDHMRYLAECRKMQQMAADRKAAETKDRKKTRIFMH